MTNLEAIRIINQYDCNFYWADGEKIPTEDLIEAFELAVKALDATEPRVLTLEQEPIKVERRMEETEWNVCGNCGSHVIHKWAYCPYCGKRLKWDE